MRGIVPCDMIPPVPAVDPLYLSVCHPPGAVAGCQHHPLPTQPQQVAQADIQGQTLDNIWSVVI